LAIRSARVGLIDQLHHERAEAVRLLETVDLGNARLIQGSQRLCFALEPRSPIRICQRLGRGFDRHIRIELPITRAVNLRRRARAARPPRNCDGNLEPAIGLEPMAC